MRVLFRLLLVALVLADLGFVYITEAASWIWLGPLLLLTVASPLLLPLRRHLSYRLLWNGSVLAAFTILVQHASRAGVAYLLEDGLLLAALCQVHLLNNIGPDQKPDLLFFNSFLIAVVTSYLSLDLMYSVLFLVYAPLLVLALQVYALLRSGGEGRGSTGRVLRDGLVRAAAAVGITMLVFLYLPRDFHRKGLLGDRIRFRPPAGMLEADFTEEVTLGRSGPMRVSDRVVLTVRLLSGTPADVPGYFRGATLDFFDGRHWRYARGTSVPGDERWVPAGDGTFARPGHRGAARIRVELLDPHATRLFLPLSAVRFALEGGGRGGRVAPLPDLTVYRPRSGLDRQSVSYTATLSRPGRAAGRTRRSRVPRRVPAHLRNPAGKVPPAARSLAERIARDLPADAPQRVVVEAFRSFLSRRYRYLLPGQEGSARDLGEFLRGGAGGHCEYFATALAVLLRIRGIPCRLVTGYRSEEWDAANRVLAIRARHAHAWVEVLDPDAGWMTVDPTPPGDGAAGAAGEGILARLGALLNRTWNEVTGFDEKARRRAVAWLAALPSRVGAGIGRRPWLLLLALLPAGGLWLRRTLRRRRVPPEVRAWLAAAGSLGLERPPGETPRAFLARARRRALPPKRLRRLEETTAAHEAARYR